MMRIRKLFIKKLFNIFDHDIPFKTEERVTIIHGPNGVGKTTILKLVADLFGKRFHTLRVCPYQKLNIEFEKPRSTMTVERLLPEKPDHPVQLKFILKKGKKHFEYSTKASRVIKDIRKHMPVHIIEDFIESLERIGPTRWIDHSTGDVLDIEDVIYTYGDVLPVDVPATLIDIPDWLEDFFSELPVHFIQTQRLVATPIIITSYERRPSKRKPTATVERYSQDMVDQIQNSLRQSAVRAASLDRTFPHRLLESELFDNPLYELPHLIVHSHIDYWSLNRAGT
jgi:hypothetical protein